MPQAGVKGASMQRFLPPAALAAVPKFTATNTGRPANNVYDAMVGPLAGISLSGAVFYQGETGALLSLAVTHACRQLGVVLYDIQCPGLHFKGLTRKAMKR